MKTTYMLKSVNIVIKLYESDGLWYHSKYRNMNIAFLDLFPVFTSLTTKK